MPAPRIATTAATAIPNTHPSPLIKRNTVDYIPSKLSCDTAIPVSILADRTEFITGLTPYDIIDGSNPLDEVQEADTDIPASDRRKGDPNATKHLKTEGDARRGSWKRSRSPLKRNSQSRPVKLEADAVEQTTLAETFTRPSRPGWAAEHLSEEKLHQLLRSGDMELKVRYVLDDTDYDWCCAQGIEPEAVQRGITYLEWAYVSSLLAASAPHLEIETVLPSAHGTLQTSLDSLSSSASTSTSVIPSSTAATMAAQLARWKRQNKRDRGSVSSDHGSANGICALCSKRVYLLSPIAQNSPLSRSGSERQGSPSAPLSSAAWRIRPSTSARGGGGSYAGSVPSHDLQHQGLRCCECGVVAHLRCWFLTEPPRLPDAWTCDGCTNYAHHRKRSAGICVVCSRGGGVLLLYVSTMAKEEAQNGERLSNAASVVTKCESVCHTVCALAMPELAIHNVETALRRNGLVDMEMRPYVYPLRRIPPQKYAMQCVLCEHGGAGKCVQCQHPHCFESMHASCAAEARTVDCHAKLSSTFPTRFPSPVPVGEVTADGQYSCSVDDSGSGGGVDCGPFSPGGVPPNSGPLPSWASCSTYCRRHYGYSVGNSVGSAALADKAESEALSLELTGLLTGEDGVTSPTVRKRGRGRPPAALVRQRGAERTLIAQLQTYWQERREQRRRSSGQWVTEINSRQRPVVQALLRPEIVKVSAEKVRLSHFISLVPEWQWQLVSVVEGELPLPDEECDEVQKYRKVAHTRRSGNTRTLYEKMSLAATQLDLVCQVTEAMKQQCQLKSASAGLEVETLRLLCAWK